MPLAWTEPTAVMPVPSSPPNPPLRLVKPSFFGVRCPCRAYIVIEEARANMEVGQCEKLNEPAWIVCPNCGDETRFTRSDLLLFGWPPEG